MFKYNMPVKKYCLLIANTYSEFIDKDILFFNTKTFCVCIAKEILCIYCQRNSNVYFIANTCCVCIAEVILCIYC